MNILSHEYEVLDSVFPGLLAELKETPLASKEGSENPLIERFRKYGGPGLLAERRFGGKGASPREAVAVHRALGAHAPSLAIAATMHNFTVGFLAEYTLYGEETMGYLREIGEQGRYLASGFAEGKRGANILEPLMTAEPQRGGYVLNGVKKPCSVSESMDYLTASINVLDANGKGGQRAIAIVPAGSRGIERKPFWTATALAGAQTKEVTLTDVFVDASQVFFPQTEVDLDAVEAGAFFWFESIVSASYLGLASRLVEKVYEAERGTSDERVRLFIDVESAASALYGIAHDKQAVEVVDERLVTRALLVRFGVQESIGRVAYRAAELLGGLHFIRDPEVEYLLAACSALAYHPPSRLAFGEPIDAYAKGGALQVA